MKSSAGQGLVPRLRFPEFLEAGEWEERKLIDICKKITQGGTPDTSNPDYWNGSIEWLTPAEMGKIETRFIDSTVRKITITGLKNCSSDLLPINSVIISTRAPIGHLAINKSEMAINQGCKGLIPKELTNYDFLYYALFIFKSSLIDLGAGNTFKELSGNSLKNFEISLPSFPEQQKIANCLSSLDDLISAETQQLATLKAHKKALMQQLFPAEGETVPQLRFPEFLGAGEWEEKTLGDICDCIVSGRNKPKSFTGNIPWITIPDIQGVKIHSSISKLGLSIEEIKECGAKIVPKNSVIMSCVGTFGLVSICEQDLVINQQLHAWLPSQIINNYYLLYSLVLHKNQMERMATHTTIAYLNKDSCNAIIISFPSLPEQQKIASCLSSLDDLITAQTQKINTLKQHKKGLMQQLFPLI
ncbi:restriction endonuclease S subunit [Beggiatoa alba B18LD]|uniref:Restriction endonuclease S subunit n=1 Tax=Beggiatoa alba B18LD TaxID=395493 RepID=I3CBT7_9GAMM|nr:restriction endonuclease S subunit [Beggiatoa alba B18LD]